jgi:hypothetical protein
MLTRSVIWHWSRVLCRRPITFSFQSRRLLKIGRENCVINWCRQGQIFHPSKHIIMRQNSNRGGFLRSLEIRLHNFHYRLRELINQMIVLFPPLFVLSFSPPHHVKMLFDFYDFAPVWLCCYVFIIVLAPLSLKWSLKPEAFDEGGMKLDKLSIQEWSQLSDFQFIQHSLESPIH